MKVFRSILSVLLVVAIGCATPSANNTYVSIGGQEAMERMEKEQDYIILDVRTPEEYSSGHLPNAINVPVETIQAKPSELPNTDQVIFVYCRSGNRSKQASQKLVELGYANIVEIGGINAWPGEIVQ